MFVAIPVWHGRVSPVFDVAGQMLVVELCGDSEVARREVALLGAEPDRRARVLADYSWQAQVTKMERVYQELRHGPKKGEL